jgi:hypothetical protein
MCNSCIPAVAQRAPLSGTNRPCILFVALAPGATSVWRDDCSIDRQEISYAPLLECGLAVRRPCSPNRNSASKIEIK